MDALAEKGLTDRAGVFPAFFQKTACIVTLPIKPSLTQTFNFHQAGFSSLATADTFTKLKTQLIEIDVTAELAIMTATNLLEVTVPVMGLVDVLNPTICSKSSLPFSCVLGINEWGAASEVTTNDFPRADFVTVTDIADNKYEIVVNEDGTLEIPQEGMGLFSIIKSITFFYSNEQLKEGKGLANLSTIGLKKNKLYLLPAGNTTKDHAIHVSISHLNEKGQRRVDSLRKVEISYQLPPVEIVQQTSSVKRYDVDIKELLYVDLAFSILTPTPCRTPLTVSVTLEPLAHVEYGYDAACMASLVEKNGFLPHPILSNVYTKHYGLSERTLTKLLKFAYSPNDFARDYLAGDRFLITEKNNYNNFILRPEAFFVYYQLLIGSLVNQEISRDFLMGRIFESRLAEQNLSKLTTDLHDSIVLNELQVEFANYKFDNFYSLFAANYPPASPLAIEDYLYVHAANINNTLPKVSVEVASGLSFTQQVVSFMETNSLQKEFDKLANTSSSAEPILTSPSHEHPLQLGEIMDFASLNEHPADKESKNENFLFNPELNKQTAKQDTNLPLDETLQRKFTPFYKSNTRKEMSQQIEKPSSKPQP